MAALTVFFPGGVYPEGYIPPIPGYDFNPSLGELIDLFGSSVVSQSATHQLLQLANGLAVAAATRCAAATTPMFSRAASATTPSPAG